MSKTNEIQFMTDLVLVYLNTYDYYVDNVKVTEFTHKIPEFNHKSIKFSFYGTNAEVKIYNSEYVEVRIVDTPGTVCNDLTSVKRAIDMLPRVYAE